MSPIGGERASVQNPMIRYAQEAGWEYLPADEPLRLRRGEGKALLHDVLVQQLQRLNPGIVDLVRAEQIIARLERMPPTIEGNLQVWEYLVLLPVALLQHPSCAMDLEPCTAGVSCDAQVANGRMPSGGPWNSNRASGPPEMAQTLFGCIVAGAQHPLSVGN